MKIVLADLDWKSPFPVCLYQLMNASCAAGALLASQPNMSSVQSYSQGKVTAKGAHQAVPNCMGVECAQIILDPFFLVLQVAEQQVAAAGALRGWGRHSCSSCRIKVSIYKKEWHKPLWFCPSTRIVICAVMLCIEDFSPQALYIRMLWSLLTKGDVLGCAVCNVGACMVPC